MITDTDMNTAQAAEFLKYSRSHIYNLIHARAIPYSKFRGRIVFHRSELEAWKASQTVNHATDDQLASRAAASTATSRR